MDEHTSGQPAWTFELHPLRLSFRARDPIHFPHGKAGNTLRGALGSTLRGIACTPDCPGAQSCELRHECAYARLFEPAALAFSPSGLRDWPRPFVFRAARLDGKTILPGESFECDLNIFEVRDPGPACLLLALLDLAREGLGPSRGRAELQSVWQLDEGGQPHDRICDSTEFNVPSRPLRLNLSRTSEHVEQLRVHFVTPTELKSGSTIAKQPEFPILFARIRDRVSTLCSLYGSGPLEIDFKSMGERAALVRMTACEIKRIDVTRRSSRTGQAHGLGGFVGWADYQGQLAEFLPFLRAAKWTGVGRHCVWGNGEIALDCSPPSKPKLANSPNQPNA
jgi:hypothetical protein